MQSTCVPSALRILVRWGTWLIRGVAHFYSSVLMAKRTLFAHFGLPERAAKLPKQGDAGESEPMFQAIPGGADPGASASLGERAERDNGAASDHTATASVVDSTPSSGDEPWRRPFRIVAEQRYPFRKFENPDDVYNFIPRDDPYWMEDSCHHEDCFCHYCVIVYDKGEDDSAPTSGA